MNIKKGDNVIVITGKDRSKTGKVVSVFKEANRVMVEGVNLYKKHKKPKKQGEKGQIVSLARPLQASNVMLYCSSCKAGRRVGIRMEGDKKVRYCKKCQITI